MSRAANDDALDRIFRTARTFRKFKPEPVTPPRLMAIYELMKLGPTSGNIAPGRIAFVVSKEAKERLLPHLDKGNVEQTMAAPATAILAYDLKFYELLPKLRPTRRHALENMLKKTPEEREFLALQSGTLQAGYFILAARALGLDCGPMGGFDREGVDRTFFPDGRWKSNVLCNLGIGDEPDMPPREPRPDFDEACLIL